MLTGGFFITIVGILFELQFRYGHLDFKDKIKQHLYSAYNVLGYRGAWRRRTD